MKANELRIGNYVKFPNLEKPIKVSIIDTTETDSTTKCEPIPLTKEWLLSFDFYENRSNNSWQLDTKYGFAIWGRIEKGFNAYVHQLQNLYFCLVGKELTLKQQS